MDFKRSECRGSGRRTRPKKLRNAKSRCSAGEGDVHPDRGDEFEETRFSSLPPDGSPALRHGDLMMVQLLAFPLAFNVEPNARYWRS
jgi:hypothetical protein